MVGADPRVRGCPLPGLGSDPVRAGTTVRLSTHRAACRRGLPDACSRLQAEVRARLAADGTPDGRRAGGADRRWPGPPYARSACRTPPTGPLATAPSALARAGACRWGVPGRSPLGRADQGRIGIALGDDQPARRRSAPAVVVGPAGLLQQRPQQHSGPAGRALVGAVRAHLPPAVPLTDFPLAGPLTVRIVNDQRRVTKGQGRSANGCLRRSAAPREDRRSRFVAPTAVERWHP